MQICLHQQNKSLMLMPCVPMIHVAAKWMHAFNQDWVLVQSSLQKMSKQDVRTHPSMVLLAMAQEIKLSAFFRDSKLTFLLVWRSLYSVRSSASLFNGKETFWLVMMSLGGGRAIITIRAAIRDCERRRGCQRSWEVNCHRSCPFAQQAAERGLW